jgi:hypothetical protein
VSVPRFAVLTEENMTVLPRSCCTFIVLRGGVVN